MLPLLHALSGCDTTSFLFGKGKRAFMNAVAEMNVATDMASVCKGLEVSKTIYVVTQLVSFLVKENELL